MYVGINNANSFYAKLFVPFLLALELSVVYLIKTLLVRYISRRLLEIMHTKFSTHGRSLITLT